LNGAFQKHSSCDGPQTEAGEGGREQNRTKPQERTSGATGPRLLLALTKRKKDRGKNAAGQVARNGKSDKFEQPLPGSKRLATVNVAEQSPPFRQNQSREHQRQLTEFQKTALR
jgi:hypothetical protein